MSEMSMYETLMELPLFKGASIEQISTLIEKFHLDFNTYLPGSRILAEGTKCQSLKCVLSGEVKIVHPLMSGKLLVHETAGRGRYIGFERLFGLDNQIPFSVHALTRCGTLDISKSQYMRLLQTEQIYLFNALNFLSRSAQRNEDAIIRAHTISLISTLVLIIDMTTVKSSRNIYFESVGSTMENLLGNISVSWPDELRDLLNTGIVRLTSPTTMQVTDRAEFIKLGRISND